MDHFKLFLHYKCYYNPSNKPNFHSSKESDWNSNKRHKTRESEMVKVTETRSCTDVQRKHTNNE
jgi:hypothetical protein